MSGSAHFDQLQQIFADQFSDGERGFIYRKYQTGAPIRVSKFERDGFLTTFNKRIRYAAWSLVPATVALILLLVWLYPDADTPTAHIAMWVGLATIILPILVYFFWAWGAPSRELERRVPEGSALTKEEARTLAFSKITYGQLALAALIGIGLIWSKSAKVDVFHGSGLVWLFFGTVLVAVAGVQAIRKWRLNQH